MVTSIDKKMINSVRTSRRTMFGGIILCVFSVIALMVVKDMNDKLTVMTSSNSGYQKMTDSQANRINQLNAELKNSKKEYSKDIESFHKTQNELKSKRMRHMQLQGEYGNQVIYVPFYRHFLYIILVRKSVPL